LRLSAISSAANLITFVQQSLDRICIAAATASVRGGWRQAGQGERARALLAEEDFLAPRVPSAELTFQSKSRFTFPSVVRKTWDTPTACGRFRRTGRDWQKRPAVIMLHGWNGEMGYYFSFPWIERALAANGVNALAFELPFHGRRRPRRSGEIHNLISDDLETMVDGMRHCLADALSLRLWLLEQGCPSVSLWGYSLGGWLAGLLAAHPERPFECAVLMNPVSRMDLALATLPFGAPAREGMREQPLDFQRLNLVNHKPTVKRTLIMAGLRDLFVPAGTLDDLAGAWPNSELWRMKHSHISIILGTRTLWRAVRWVQEQVSKG
jgi:pimeloyl-ACP methyl ester carboxylesterase